MTKHKKVNYFFIQAVLFSSVLISYTSSYAWAAYNHSNQKICVGPYMDYSQEIDPGQRYVFPNHGETEAQINADCSNSYIFVTSVNVKKGVYVDVFGSGSNITCQVKKDGGEQIGNCPIYTGQPS